MLLDGAGRAMVRSGAGRQWWRHGHSRETIDSSIALCIHDFHAAVGSCNGRESRPSAQVLFVPSAMQLLDSTAIHHGHTNSELTNASTI